MKRTVAVLLAIFILCSLAVPAAAEDFVPSISYKDHPEVPNPPELTDKEDKTEEKLDDGCVVIIPVSDAADKPVKDRTEEEQLLVDLYEQLEDGSMKLPYEEGSEDMVIRDLVVVEMECEDGHVEDLKKPEKQLKVDFDLGVDANTEVVVMAYIDEQWVPLAGVVNNGDGTITILLDELCPLAFSVPADTLAPVPPTGDPVGQSILFWIIMLVASAGAMVVLVSSRHRRRRR